MALACTDPQGSRGNGVPGIPGERGCRDSVALATSACHTIMLAGMLFHTRLACVRLCHVTTAVCQTIMVAGMLAQNRLACVRLCHMTTSVCQTTMVAGMLFHNRLACVRLGHTAASGCQVTVVAGMLFWQWTSLCQAMPRSGVFLQGNHDRSRLLPQRSGMPPKQPSGPPPPRKGIMAMLLKGDSETPEAVPEALAAEGAGEDEEGEEEEEEGT